MRRLDPIKGIRVDASREFVSWDALTEKFRIVNRSTGNNRCAVSAVCYKQPQ